MMRKSTTDSIAEWLRHSRSVRESRLDKLNEFDIHSDSKSSTPMQIQSPFLKKYEYAQSKLERLQQQLFDIRVSSPPLSEKKRYISNTPSDIDKSLTQSHSNTLPINDESSINQDKTMKKSHSEYIMPHNDRNSISNIKQRKHSQSQDHLLNDISTNPYSVNEIYPSLINTYKLSQKKKHSLSNNSSSKLINENKKKHQQKTEQIRRSLMELESTSYPDSSNTISTTKSKRKSPRKPPSILKEKSPLHTPIKHSFHSPKRRTNRSLSVSFVDDTNNNTINRVRESILFEENKSPKSIFSSPSAHGFKSPKSTNSLLVIAEEDKVSDDASNLRSPKSPSSVLSRRSTVHDLVDESERTIVDKQSSIDIYRLSILEQLKHAESKRQSVLEQKQHQNMALHHFKRNFVHKIMCEWREYTANEIVIGYKYRENKVKLKCLNEWKRMYSIINIIRTQRYLRIWRRSNVDSFIEIEKLLDSPTRSRWSFLKIISILRLSRNVFHRKRYRIVFNKIFSRYRTIIVFVLFCSWRSIAQQKNIAAFNIIQMITKHDENMIINTLRIWKLNTKQNRLKRKNAVYSTKKLHKNHIYKVYFTKWMELFVYESTMKIALYHWCHKMEQNVFNHWMNYKVWSIEYKGKADKLFRRNVLKRYFVFWLDEFIRIQNEREWKKWRETKQKTIQREHEKKQYSYISAVHSVDIPQNLFFPYYGASNTPQIEIQIPTSINDERLSYIKHCELQNILIPNYDKSMAAKYK